MRQLLALAWKDVYITFTDRSLLLIMLLTPLLLSTIIGLVFGGLGGDNVSFGNIPIAIVNQDEGTQINGQPFNFGDIFVGIVVPSGGNNDALGGDTACTMQIASSDGQQSGSLDDLLTTTLIDDPEVARAGVREGTYTAAIILPPDLSSSSAPSFSAEIDLEANAPDANITQTQIEVYANEGQQVLSSVVNAVTEGINNQIVTGNITIAATIDTLIQRAQTMPAFGVRFLASNATGSFNPEFGCAFQSGLGTISVDQIPLNRTQEENAFVQIVVTTGAAQAVFFALFTSFQGILSIFNEKRDGTLQRLMVAPIPRRTILLGKLLGSSLSVMLQIIVLLFALTSVVSIVEGQPMFIWGDNVFLIAVTILVLTLSISGIGVIIVGLSNSPEQAQLFGPIVNVAFGALGGAFGFAVPETVAQFSPVYWGARTFLDLSMGDTDIAVNLIVLLVQGAVMFAIGAYLFNRRVDV